MARFYMVVAAWMKPRDPDRRVERGAVAEAGPCACKSLIIGMCKPLPPGSAPHRIEIMAACATRPDEPLAAIEQGIRASTGRLMIACWADWRTWSAI
jgi:hypothetical protein